MHLYIISVLPIEMLLSWHSYPWLFGEIGCKIAVMFSELVTIVSVATLSAFTVER